MRELFRAVSSKDLHASGVNGRMCRPVLADLGRRPAELSELCDAVGVVKSERAACQCKRKHSRRVQVDACRSEHRLQIMSIGDRIEK